MHLFLYCFILVQCPLSVYVSRSFLLKKAYQLIVLEDDKHYDEYIEWYRDTTYALAQKAGMEEIPEVAIYESSDPNAFATGRSKNSSLVAVSTALLYKMTPEAVEAVIAHEVAHIVNGDMVTQTLFAILSKYDCEARHCLTTHFFPMDYSLSCKSR